MRIVMFTNTYLPHVGGVARSVSTTADELRRRGAHVGIVAPQFENATESTDDVLRVPAIQNFSGSDFSVRIPQPAVIGDFLDRFAPDAPTTQATAVEQARAVAEVAAAVQVAQQNPRDIRRAWAEMEDACRRFGFELDHSGPGPVIVNVTVIPARRTRLIAWST